MSGPVTRDDTSVGPDPTGGSSPPELEILASRQVELGGVPVRRALPKRAHRTVGAWCFLDHFGPTEPAGEMQIGPHPHMGLQTVTWLVEGAVLHRDSLGTEQRIEPGQLNLMTAGHGISHSEETPIELASRQMGVQLWVAQPDPGRHGEPSFEHHAELPSRIEGGWAITVLTGALGHDLSPARTQSPLVGAALAARGPARTRLDLDPTFEHGLVVMRGSVEIGGTTVAPGSLVYLAPGHDTLWVDAADTTDAILVGGVPFPEPISMFWNFVGRDRDEMRQAREDWMTGHERFGEVASAVGRIDSPPFV